MTNDEQVRVFGSDTTHLNPAGFDTLVEITAFIKSKHNTVCANTFFDNKILLIFSCIGMLVMAYISKVKIREKHYKKKSNFVEC